MMVLEPAVKHMRQSVIISKLETAVQERIADCIKGISGYHMPPSRNFVPLKNKT